MDKFWMVFVEGGAQPRKQWEVEADALAEAERLARKEGKPAYLLESVAVCGIAELPVTWQMIQARPAKEANETPSSESWRTSPRMT